MTRKVKERSASWPGQSSRRSVWSIWREVETERDQDLSGTQGEYRVGKWRQFGAIKMMASLRAVMAICVQHKSCPVDPHFTNKAVAFGAHAEHCEIEIIFTQGAS